MFPRPQRNKGGTGKLKSHQATSLRAARNPETHSSIRAKANFRNWPAQVQSWKGNSTDPEACSELGGRPTWDPELQIKQASRAWLTAGGRTAVRTEQMKENWESHSLGPLSAGTKHGEAEPQQNCNRLLVIITVPSH